MYIIVIHECWIYDAARRAPISPHISPYLPRSHRIFSAPLAVRRAPRMHEHVCSDLASGAKLEKCMSAKVLLYMI